MSAAAKLDLSRCPEVFENCLAFNIRRADRLVTQVYDEALRPSGIRATQYSLMIGLRAMEPVTMSALSAQLGVDRTTLTRNLKVLELEGLATSGAGEDLRERRIELTAKGHRALHAAFGLWQATQRRIEEKVGAKNIAALLKQLTHMTTLHDEPV